MLSTAIKAYQDTVRKCSAHSEQRLKAGVLEPSDVEKDFWLIGRSGRAEQSFRAIGSGLACASPLGTLWRVCGASRESFVMSPALIAGLHKVQGMEWDEKYQELIKGSRQKVRLLNRSIVPHRTMPRLSMAAFSV